MKQFFRTAVLAVLIFVLTNGHCAFAQWDRRGCSSLGVDSTYPKTLEMSLWTFRSNLWDGYIDFREGGKYSTHWGLGTWTVTPEGHIHMANDYNQRTYEIGFFDNGFQFQGLSSDGLKISGILICAKYEGPKREVSEEVTAEIMSSYQGLLGREPSVAEMEASTRQYIQHQTIDRVQEVIMATPEYQEKAAIAAEAAAAAAAASQPDPDGVYRGM